MISALAQPRWDAIIDRDGVRWMSDRIGHHHALGRLGETIKDAWSEGPPTGKGCELNRWTQHFGLFAAISASGLVALGLPFSALRSQKSEHPHDENCDHEAT